MNEHPVLDDPDQSRAQDPSSVVDLRAAGEALLEEARSTGRGRAVRAVVRQPGQSLVLLGLPAGGGLPEHDAPGPASLLCLSGRVVLSSNGTSWALPTGTARVIPTSRHDVTAAVDSVCLLTLSLPDS
ncbi:LuxR family transcriptional regulator [uncultured Serinicoccus sp.]|uniref:LuxR family transcriptional regulator n=1 Tax=uncultured Serinicoccus sp. TaxID=735514 RepID=UPI002606AA46|nr:LuxR family transcriptional regulator [uncultured Serinicoccus sp.]